jgi:hypothetical protein
VFCCYAGEGGGGGDELYIKNLRVCFNVGVGCWNVVCPDTDRELDSGRLTRNGSRPTQNATYTMTGVRTCYSFHPDVRSGQLLVPFALL